MKNKVPSCGGIFRLNGKCQFAIERKTIGNIEDAFSQVYISEVEVGQNIKFKKTNIQLQQLCNSNEEMPLRFVIVVDENPISYAQTSVKELRTNSNLELILYKN